MSGICRVPWVHLLCTLIPSVPIAPAVLLPGSPPPRLAQLMPAVALLVLLQASLPEARAGCPCWDVRHPAPGSTFDWKPVFVSLGSLDCELLQGRQNHVHLRLLIGKLLEHSAACYVRAAGEYRPPPEKAVHGNISRIIQSSKPLCCSCYLCF